MPDWLASLINTAFNLLDGIHWIVIAIPTKICDFLAYLCSFLPQYEYPDEITTFLNMVGNQGMGLVKYLDRFWDFETMFFIFGAMIIIFLVDRFVIGIVKWIINFIRGM